MAPTVRPPVPEEMLERLRIVVDALPETYEEDAWVGLRWRVGGATIAHVFGGEDQLIRIVFRAPPEEVSAFEHMGEPYFRAGWGSNVVGLVLDGQTDWDEVAELLTESYCQLAPKRLVAKVLPPGQPGSPAAG